MAHNLTQKPSTKTLSVIVPSYNEEKTIAALLHKLLAVQLPGSCTMEIIVVDDGSEDNTRSVVEKLIGSCPHHQIRYLSLGQNRGKGMAIRTGIDALRGDYVVIQDADLEYDPEDFCRMLPLLLSGEHEVVYGSRFLNKTNRHSSRSFYWGGRVVSLFTNCLYKQNLTDEPTCYKMFSARLLKSIPLQCTGFEFCPEVTAKISKLGHKIPEVPIHYHPRTVEEGKKIKWTDGLEAIYVLLKYRFTH